MKLTALSADDLRTALPMDAAIEAMKEGFADLSAGRTVSPHPVIIPVPETSGSPGGTTLIKSAYAPGALGAKMVSVFPGNRDRHLPVTPGLVVMLDPETGLPRAILEGTYVTALRTGAASGAATDLLARTDVSIGALFGTGGQAAAQAQAIDCVRDFDEIRVYSRAPESVASFVERVGPTLRSRLVAAGGPDEAIDGADVICTATTSPVPVFGGTRLKAGAHVNGVGSFKLVMREIDGNTVERSKIFVDSRQAAQGEAGDLMIAVDEGLTAVDQWTELGEVVAGQVPGRTQPEEITFFKSVGVAVQDVKACTLALEQASRLGLGREIEL